MDTKFVTIEISKRLSRLGCNEISPTWYEAMEWLEKNKIYFDRFVDQTYGHCTYNLKWRDEIAFMERPCKGGKPIEALKTAIENALNILETTKLL